MKRWRLCRVVPGAVGLLISMSSAAQAPTPPTVVTRHSFEPTMMRAEPYLDQLDDMPRFEPYSCYRARRCSLQDLYYFADRPNRLTRLAPEAQEESVGLQSSMPYTWVFIPVTPEKNILPKYRSASQVRDEYRSIGTPLYEPKR